MKGVAPIMIGLVIILAIVVAAGVWFIKPTPTTDGGALIGENVSIIFTSHGAVDDPLFIAFEKGMGIAAEMYGCKISSYYSDGDMPELADLIRTAAVSGADVLITTLPDTVMFDEPVQEAKNAGMLVISSINDDDTANPRDAFVGMGRNINYVAGYIWAKMLDQRGMLPDDAKALFPTSGPGMTWSDTEVDGIKDYVAAIGQTIDVHEINCTTEVATAEGLIRAYLTANPDLDIIFSAGGIAHMGTVQALEAEEIEPGEIGCAGWINSEVAIRGTQEGYTMGTSSITSLMGYYSVMLAALSINENVPASSISLEMIELDSTNIDKFLILAEKGLL